MATQAPTNAAIIVTGASRGIGAAIAVAIARGGVTVACLSRSGDLPAGADTLDDAGRARLLPMACDVTDEEAMRAAFVEVAQRCGGISGIVNNAGIHELHKSSEMTSADFNRVMEINATALFAACRDVLPHLRANGGGTIVNIGSFFARLGAKGSTAYCASKAAVAAITRCLAAEWGRYGVSVVNVAPGYIATDINRDYLASEEGAATVAARSFLGRPGRVEEIAALVRPLATGEIPFLTGETIYVDGGHGISL